MGDDAAAAPLLREAVQGLADVYSAEHPHVHRYQGVLDRSAERQAANAAAQPVEAPAAAGHEEETMHERMAKRRGGAFGSGGRQPGGALR
jgi:hypothetical protein